MGDEAPISSGKLLTSGKKYDTIVNASRDLGWSGEIRVFENLPSTAGGMMADGTLVVNARAYFDGYSEVLRSGAVRRISGRSIIAHEMAISTQDRRAPSDPLRRRRSIGYKNYRHR
ncbi:MAG: hypothetical protein JNL96_16935 [Planctomycetaceae bacterium]|nr:hypothetical protein [Planctomycetaceae bacterium]